MVPEDKNVKADCVHQGSIRLPLKQRIVQGASQGVSSMYLEHRRWQAVKDAGQRRQAAETHSGADAIEVELDELWIKMRVVIVDMSDFKKIVL